MLKHMQNTLIKRIDDGDIMGISIRKLQLLELEIAKEIKRICEENQIDYFLIDGTLLGAIRHKGFIPWDDDMDIGMTTENYNRFLEVAPNQLDERFFLQTSSIDKNIGYVFAKVRMKHTHFIEKVTDGLGIQDGIFVDILPYDKADSSMIRSSHMRKLQLLCKIKMLKAGYRLNNITKKPLNRLVNDILAWIPVSKEKIDSKIESEIQKGIISGNEYYIERDGMFKGTYVFRREYVDELIDVKFEDTLFKAPKNYDDFLKSAYGNYLEYPSDEERSVGHSVKGVELERPFESYFSQ